MSVKTPYPDGITSETLMAYADGALEPDMIELVEAAMAAHPALAEEVDAYRRTHAALAGAFDAPMNEEVPPHLAAMVMGGAQETETVTSLHAERVRRANSVPAWGQAAAACALFAVGSIFGSTFLGGDAADPAGDLLFAGRLDAQHPVAQALEHTASAQVVALPGGRFDSVATFLTASGDICREFETSGGGGAVVGVACRSAGDWTIELLLQAEPSDSPQAGFQLASAFSADAIDAVLSDLQAGDGLSREQEACLIASGWNAGACN